MILNNTSEYFDWDSLKHNLLKDPREFLKIVANFDTSSVSEDVKS